MPVMVQVLLTEIVLPNFALSASDSSRVSFLRFKALSSFRSEDLSLKDGLDVFYVHHNNKKR